MSAGGAVLLDLGGWVVRLGCPGRTDLFVDLPVFRLRFGVYSVVPRAGLDSRCARKHIHARTIRPLDQFGLI